MLLKLKHLKKNLKTWVYKALKIRSFKTLGIEERSVQHLPYKKQEAAIVSLRFEAWVKHFDISCDKTQKRKMRLAFMAGFYSRELE